MEQITYFYVPTDDRLKLMAWVWMAQYHQTVYAEIDGVDGTTRTAWVSITGYLYKCPVPFSAIQSVALVQGSETLEAFGHPPAAELPAWIEYTEASP